MLFRGNTPRNLDPKGRLMLPPEFREVLAARGSENSVVLTCRDECIVGVPVPEWLEIEEKFNQVKNLSRAMRDFKRGFIGSAKRLDIDAQGRVNLPRAHLDYGNLAHNIIIVGQLDVFEIWDQARYDKVISQDIDVAEELDALGIDLPF